MEEQETIRWPDRQPRKIRRTDWRQKMIDCSHETCWTTEYTRLMYCTVEPYITYWLERNARAKILCLRPVSATGSMRESVLAAGGTRYKWCARRRAVARLEGRGGPWPWPWPTDGRTAYGRHVDTVVSAVCGAVSQTHRVQSTPPSSTELRTRSCCCCCCWRWWSWSWTPIY